MSVLSAHDAIRETYAAVPVDQVEVSVPDNESGLLCLFISWLGRGVDHRVPRATHLNSPTVQPTYVR